MKQLLLTAVILLSADILFSQRDADITEYLIMIEKGKSTEVREILPDIKRKFPASPSVFYLEGVLTENAETAVKLYKSVLEKYPDCAYADAAAFRLYSYYSALDKKNDASKYYDALINGYPDSPYLKMLPAGENITTGKSPEYLYTIQAGAFANISNAENLRRKFLKAGYHTVVKDKTVGGTVFKIVFTGRFKTRREAESFQLILNRNYGLKGIITDYQE